MDRLDVFARDFLDAMVTYTGRDQEEVAAAIAKSVIVACAGEPIQSEAKCAKRKKKKPQPPRQSPLVTTKVRHTGRRSGICHVCDERARECGCLICPGCDGPMFEETPQQCLQMTVMDPDGTTREVECPYSKIWNELEEEEMARDEDDPYWDARDRDYEASGVYSHRYFAHMVNQRFQAAHPDIPLNEHENHYKPTPEQEAEWAVEYEAARLAKDAAHAARVAAATRERERKAGREARAARRGGN